MLALMLAATVACQTHGPTLKTQAPPEVLYESYPQAAKTKGVEGKARVSCQIDAQGRAGDCKVLNEEPAGFGFGEGAIRVVRHMTLNPGETCGGPVKGVFETSVDFKFGPDLNSGPALSAALLAKARTLVETIGFSDNVKINTISNWTQFMLESGNYSEAQHQAAADMAGELWAAGEQSRVDFIANLYARLYPDLIDSMTELAATEQGRKILRAEMDASFLLSYGFISKDVRAGLRDAFCQRAKACAAAY